MPPRCKSFRRCTFSASPIPSLLTRSAPTPESETSMSVELENGTEELSTFVSKLKSPIETLDLSIFSNEDTSDPMVALSPISASLKTLKVGSVDLRGAVVIFPNVTTLQLDIIAMKDLEPLLYSFPNLRRLTFHHPTGTTFEKGDGRIRVNNQAAQRRWQRWRSLDLLEGALPALYVFAVACDVQLVKIAGRFTPNALPKLHAVLQDTRPSSLTLHDVDARQVHAPLMGTLLPPALKISRLNLVISFIWEETCVDLVLSQLYNHLGDYSISQLDIELRCKLCPCRRRIGEEGTANCDPSVHDNLSLNGNVLVGLDLHVVAQHLFERIGTLKMLQLQLYRVNPYSASGGSWKVIRDGETRSLVSV
ncbi:hypothetical protein OF83DRAFT_500152 [Amylostereum chailletii]|nr:hypothetical protein OF83DRAFT_500152 [Amylostereum chailletii]